MKKRFNETVYDLFREAVKLHVQNFEPIETAKKVAAAGYEKGFKDYRITTPGMAVVIDFDGKNGIYFDGTSWHMGYP